MPKLDLVKEFKSYYRPYIRDFMKDNSNKTRNDAIKYWKIKKFKPGDNKYSKTDLI